MFSFVCHVAGAEVPLETVNMFEAKRQARKLGASKLICSNPCNQQTFELAF